MKRILCQVFVFISGLLFLGASAPKQLAFEVLFKDFDYKVNFYSLTELDEEDLKTVNAGNFYIITSSKEKEKEIEAKLDVIIGKSYELENAGFDLDKFISKYRFEIKIIQNLENSEVWYLYSNKLNGEIAVNGKIINLQIAVKENSIIAGSPVILGSY